MFASQSHKDSSVVRSVDSPLLRHREGTRPGFNVGFCLGLVLGFFKTRLKLPRDGRQILLALQGYLPGRDPGDPCTACVASGDVADLCSKICS